MTKLVFIITSHIV